MALSEAKGYSGVNTNVTLMIWYFSKHTVKLNPHTPPIYVYILMVLRTVTDAAAAVTRLPNSSISSADTKAFFLGVELY